LVSPDLLDERLHRIAAWKISGGGWQPATVARADEVIE
jgi:hypothetical protein